MIVVTLAKDTETYRRILCHACTFRTDGIEIRCVTQNMASTVVKRYSFLHWPNIYVESMDICKYKEYVINEDYTEI